MPGNNGSVQLSEEIAKLKKDLNLSYKKRKSLIHPETMAISMLLDEKIVLYMRMKNNIKTENDVLKEKVTII